MKQYRRAGVPWPRSLIILWIKAIILLPVVPSPVQMSRHRKLSTPSPDIANRRLYLSVLLYSPACLTLLPTYAFPIPRSAVESSIPHSSRSIISHRLMSAIPYGYGKFQYIQRFDLLMGKRAWYAVVLPLFQVSPIRFSASDI